MSTTIVRVLVVGVLVTACADSSVKVLNEGSAKALIEKATQSKNDGSTAEIQAGGPIEVGEVTNLRLVTETRAAANFVWQSTTNRDDRGVGMAEFVKKPDGSWALTAVKTHDVASIEAFAIGSLRAINSAQSTFAASCGSGYYSPTLTSLGTAPTGGAMPFISPDLSASASVTKSGYIVTMSSSTGAFAGAPASCNGLAAGVMVSGYFATATPIGGVGRSFGTNTTGTIYEMQPNGKPMAITDADTGASGASPIR